ncbi:MAG: DUF2167 domain-containing protein [Deltaproteobacteria bacterium]|nr:DUF2167 domain-containing protein [Deltaproteobacteria bacterium]
MRHNFFNLIYRLTILSVFFMLQTCTTGLAQENSEDSIFEKVKWLEGPSTAKIDEWAEITVPEGFLFADGSDTRILMEAMGNTVSEREVGFLGPQTLEWFVIFEFDDVGYIKDDEKNSLDADAILKTIQNGTEAGNKIRMEKGYPTLTLQGWEVPPYYDEKTHNLEWAIKGVDSNGEGFLNHNTRLLGRRGVMQVTLVVDPPMFQEVLPAYQAQLSEFTFKSGEDYASYRQGDKLAGYGLAALVAGGAAAKLGFFKVIAKFSKVIFLAIAAFVGGFWKKIKRLFGKSE